MCSLVRTTPPAAIAPDAASSGVWAGARARGLTTALALLVLLSSAAQAGTGNAELQAALDTARPDDEIAVIVSYRGKFQPKNFRKLAYEEGGEDLAVVAESRRVHRREIIAGLRQSAASEGSPIVKFAREKGARAVRVLWLSNSIALRAKREVIWQLLADRRVGQVRLDQVVVAPVPMAGPSGPVEWNISAVGAPALWTQGYDGNGAVVAILDSGADVAHPDLQASYRGGTNSWYDPYGEHASPYDRLGHGTQALGLIVGGSLSGAAIGVAPGAKWMAAKIFNDAGSASESAIHLAYQWVLDPDGNPATDDAPDVVSNSWDIASENVCNSVFQADIDALKAADIAVVFAAGNFGPNTATSVSPANNASVVSVGSVDVNSVVSAFSSRGPSACDGSVFPKVVAPGDGVQTTDLSFGGMPLYLQVSGTSFSAPEVTGVVALLRGAVPMATAAEVEAVLASTAQDLGAAGPDPDTGYGLVDAAAAYVTLSQPVDEDGDGYAVSSDCDDQDPSVFPGAREVRRDGVDQDCNGYDLTIDVKYAVYSHDGSKLSLRVSSSLRARAALEIVGVGPLTWRKVRRDWIFDAATPPGPMKQIIIRGIEGEVKSRPRPPMPTR
jgi:serine protease AprX